MLNLSRDGQISTPPRSVRWEYLLSGVLLSATLLNYAARQALPAASVRVQQDLGIDAIQYGEAAGVFSLAFGAGALFFGTIADTVGVRWLYPLVVLCWSGIAIATGRVETFAALWWYQLLLGVFESGHWPSALRTTQRVFSPARRTLGNALLQSGAAIGAVVVCLLMLGLVIDTPESWRPVLSSLGGYILPPHLFGDDVGRWRLMFVVIGAGGIPWAIAWLMTVRESDLRRPVLQSADTAGADAILHERPLWQTLFSRRFALLIFMVICINFCWHFIRVWLPMLLEKDLKYSAQAVQWAMIGYWGSTLLGAMISGSLVTWLARLGWPVQRARMGALLLFALTTALMVVAARLPASPLLLGMLMLVGAGSLAQFPIYYSLTQELSGKHQGKIGGILGLLAWLPLFWFHPFAGELIENDPQARTMLFTGVGLLPLLAWCLVSAAWGKNQPRQPS
ncbi:MAG: MFS transporter [Pirellulales bacterium]